jgi:hypothetical protein
VAFRCSGQLVQSFAPWNSNFLTVKFYEFCFLITSWNRTPVMFHNHGLLDAFDQRAGEEFYVVGGGKRAHDADAEDFAG